MHTWACHNLCSLCASFTTGLSLAALIVACWTLTYCCLLLPLHCSSVLGPSFDYQQDLVLRVISVQWTCVDQQVLILFTYRHENISSAHIIRT